MSEYKGPIQSRATTWIRFYTENYLFGSTKAELEPDERSVWVDFLCLAVLQSGDVEIYSRKMTAGQLVIQEELLDRSIKKFVEHGKIEKITAEEDKRERFRIVNWDKYQSDYLKKRDKRAAERETDQQSEDD